MSRVGACCKVMGESNPARLTPRQDEVLRLAATGMKYTAIADELGIGPQTVKGHLRAVRERLNVGSVIEAFIARGWLQVDA